MAGASTATSILLGAATLCRVASASAGQVDQITSFGANPTGIGMYLYTPTNVAAKPAILVGVHACHGKGTDVCSQGSGWAAQADKYGFLLICPSAVSSDGCWDVHSSADLSHNGGGDAAGIISMVNYVVQDKNGDISRVYVAGHSSGGMMTNVLLGSYPDVFKAGAAFAGVAFGCYAIGAVDSLGWNAGCANGNVTQTGAQWGDMVRAADPGFMGTRPRIQLWHGTADMTVNFHNFGEEIKEWTNVLGVGATPTTTENDAIQATWIRTRYADNSGVVQVEAIQETGQPHNLVIDQAEAIHFLGLDGTGPSSISDAGVRGGVTDGQAGSEASAGVAHDSGTDAAGGTSGGRDGGGGSSGSGGASNGGGSAGTNGGGGSPDASGGGMGPGSMGPGSMGPGSMGPGSMGASGGGGGTSGGTGGAGAPSAGAGSSGSAASNGSGGSGSSSGASLAGSGDSGGGGASTASGGSAGNAAGRSGERSGGCSFAVGAERCGPTRYWLLGLLLAAGLHRKKRRGTRQRT